MEKSACFFAYCQEILTWIRECSFCEWANTNDPTMELIYGGQ